MMARVRRSLALLGEDVRDEAGVQLELADPLVAAQGHQRGVPGPELGDADPATEPHQARDRLVDGRRDPGSRLGHLEGEPVGGHPVLDEQPLHLADEAAPEQVAGRHVDRDGAARSHLVEGRVVRQRPGEHHAGQLTHQARALGEGHELAGGEQPQLGVLPAHERLEPDHLAGPDVHLRLVVQDELFVVDAVAQVLVERVPVGEDLGRGVVPLPAPRAEALRGVHGQVGGPEELVDGGPVVAVHRDAHGAPHRQLDVVEDDRGRQLQQQPVRQVLHVVGARDLADEDGELVAAQAYGEVAFPDATAQPEPELRQHLVAGVVAQGVVDALEVVDVEHQQGRGPAVAHRRRQGHLAALDQQRAGAQRGEPVQHGRAVGRVDEPALRLEAAHRGDGVSDHQGERRRPPSTRSAPGDPSGHQVQRADRPREARHRHDQLPVATAGASRFRVDGPVVRPEILPGGVGPADDTGLAGVRVQHEPGTLAVQELEGLVEGRRDDLGLLGHAHQQRAQLREVLPVTTEPTRR